MIVYDENGGIVNEIDDSIGRVIEDTTTVVHRWVVDSQAEYELRVVREYPGGGCDTERVVTCEEEGHWETYDDKGSRISWDGMIPDDWKSVGEVAEEVPFGVFVPYTDEERSFWELVHGGKVADIEDALAATDDAICELYEQGLEQSAIMDEQDAAICALYEMIGE